MAKNINISELDAGQAFKRTVDGDHDAVRVVQAFNTEMTIELSAEDGDSVQSQAYSVTIKPEDGAVDVSMLRKFCMYGDGYVTVSPDGEKFYPITCSSLKVTDICAVKMRVSNCVVVGQS